MEIRPENLDKIIHEPARLMIMTHLYAVKDADFLYLKRATEMTPGNLSTHLSKLEAAGFVEITKTFQGKKPHTILELTKNGRKAYQNYRKNIQKILET